MTDAEREKIRELGRLFAASKQLDKEAATAQIVIVDHLIEAHARGNTRDVETGLLMLRRILTQQAGD